MRVPKVGIQQRNFRATTKPFGMSYPDEPQIHRMCSHVSRGHAVRLISAERDWGISSRGWNRRRTRHDISLGKKMYKLAAWDEGHEHVLWRVLPALKLNPDVPNTPRRYLMPHDYTWFIRRTKLPVGRNELGGLIQDVALRGKGAMYKQAYKKSEILGRRYSHYDVPWEIAARELTKVIGRNEQPRYGEMSRIVLGFSLAVEENQDLPPWHKIEVDEVARIASLALDHFDVMTVVRVLLQGGAAAVAHALDTVPERRVARQLNMRLKTVIGDDISSAQRAQRLLYVSSAMSKAPAFHFFASCTMYVAAHEYLNAAHHNQSKRRHYWGRARRAFADASRQLDGCEKKYSVNASMRAYARAMDKLLSRVMG